MFVKSIRQVLYWYYNSAFFWLSVWASKVAKLQWIVWKRGHSYSFGSLVTLGSHCWTHFLLMHCAFSCFSFRCQSSESVSLKKHADVNKQQQQKTSKLMVSKYCGYCKSPMKHAVKQNVHIIKMLKCHECCAITIFLIYSFVCLFITKYFFFILLPMTQALWK